MGKRPKNLILESLVVSDAAAQGKSVAHAVDGRAVLISGAVPGDVVDARVIKKKSKYYEAQVERLIEESDKRVVPPCSHFGVCGGCKWQNMGYEWQTHYKEKEVVNNIRRIGGVDTGEILPIKGCREQYFYRNKMEFSFAARRWYTREEIETRGELEDEVGLGFHIQGRWDKVLDIEKCYLQKDPSNAIRNHIRQYAIENGIPFFDPREKKGMLRTMMIRTSYSTGEVMVLIQFFYEDRKVREALLDNIKESFPEITSLLYAINGGANDSLYELDIKTYYGQDHIYEEMEGLRFKIGPKSFYQTNSHQAYELYSTVRDFAGLTGEENVYDLYTGTGTISQFVSRNARSVVGVEAVEEAIIAARLNAQINGITNCTYLVGDMKDVFDDAFVEKYGKPDVVITDPPRDGMHKDVVEMLLKLAAPRIVYVSCNSATQARDLALMKDVYRIEKMQAVDMFPQTFHVENVALLTLIDNDKKDE
ncbi:MAG: 23S rRNA (uracil(1939)-C(5))-methyltransferase RlmD [Flavobacteriales bacterium]|jgi:23S rRNA (uracil1939-C5)-methyltransferase|nr:23S rRNA (uracil(1939)-C(5))-methyltransferase RlmD [Flavobacteriales bacterium]MBQ1968031.1 23S rRNA (uracil(1939)-C(5))-methyltransferase RlmD [Flavobacteriales bacterium]